MVLMNLLAGQEKRCRHREWTCGHSGGWRGWSGLKDTLPCVKQMAGEQLLYNTGNQLGAL